LVTSSPKRAILSVASESHYGNSALMLSCARLRHVSGTVWSAKRCLNMSLLKDIEMVDKDVA